MPVYNNVGFSKETEVKHIQLRQTISAHMKMVKGIFSRQAWSYKKYCFVDMNAGPGFYSGTKGSPVIVVEECEKHGLPLNASFIEENKASAMILYSNLNSLGVIGNSSRVFNDNHNDVLTDVVSYIPYSAYGIIFNDPNGISPSFETLNKFTSYKQTQKIDVLIYCSATNIKRDRKRNQKPSERLTVGLSKINKRHWIIRKPRCAHQWTFLIGTNWANFPEFKGMGFVSIESQEGKLVLDGLDLTKEEFESKYCMHQIKMHSYQDYLKSPEFTEVRSMAMQRDGHR